MLLVTDPRAGDDVLGDGPHVVMDGVEVVDDDLTWGHPGALGVAALVLSVLVLMGAALLQGRLYLVGLLPQENGSPDPDAYQHYARASGVLTFLIALVPLVLARLAWGRVVPSDGQWVNHVVRAAGLLACLGALLSFVRLVVLLVSEPTQFSPFL